MRVKMRSTTPSVHARRRYERADLRHNREQAGLTQVRRFPAHIRTGEQNEAALGLAQVEIVGHEPARARSLPSPDGARRQSSRRSHRQTSAGHSRVRPRTARAPRARRSRRSRRRLLATRRCARRFGRAALRRAAVPNALAASAPLNRQLEFFELGRHVALAVRQRLLSDVLGRQRPGKTLGISMRIAERRSRTSP